MRVTAKLLIVSLFLSIALMGCKNPCEDADPAPSAPPNECDQELR